ncbi:hypothetical protein LCGC14_0127730 [marine sediment metagenome]|uniref:DUF4129 domain-containing protein n=1 Tax=marine sediment metagenome TaxID=412755 RepID=A0A0F9V8P5_9ZZZZ|nr:hypothetical protein [Maribacter sp.]HDZ03591.1 hypothetical protein [Maribacter sp.]HEA80194.1 hypothetical protein [Maribacter sp.]
MKYFILLIFFQLVTLCSFAQVKNDSIIKIDSSSVLTSRSIEEDLSKKYTGDEFNYTFKTGESQNILARFINWIGQGLYNVFGITLSPQLLQVIEYFIYFLLVILAIYLIVKVLINESFNSIFQKKAKTINDINLTEEHIEGIDINNLLDSALKEKDYRLAIRYQFLLTLQKLSKNDIIEWHFDKTNSDYLTEIKQPQLQNGFKKITYLYDYIWYGEQTIDDIKYSKSILDFELINKLIKP